MLSDGPDPDGDEIGQILLEALTTAEQLGLNAFTARAGKLRERYGPEAPPRVVDQAAPQRSPSVVVLGGLEVRSADEELAIWSSRKARQLLMILVARRGAPIHRGQLAEMLWPGEDADRTRNRLDVAVSTVRRALDPRREFAAEALIESRGGRVRLRHDAVRIDLEEYMSAASERLRSPDRFTTLDLLDLANSYRGDAFPEEPYADWAEPTRTTVATRASQLYWIVARRALDDGDHLVAVEAYRRLIELDRFDHLAHLALIELFERTGGGGVLARARDSYRSAMAVLGIETIPAG